VNIILLAITVSLGSEKKGKSFLREEPAEAVPR